ncbi:MAG: hypothetical protein EBS19_07495 [Spirochaetia bacterium]|nr:hypothetical protein [Spirochaetia bacterium]
MSTIKSIYDWTRVILFFAILIILFITSISQTIILYNWVSYSVEEVEPVELTEDEISTFCSNQKCYYTHKVNLDGRDITFDWHGFHYKNKIWIFTRMEGGRKFIEHKEEFLYEYLYFDLFSIIFLYFYITSVKKENANDTNPKWKKWLQRKKKKEETEIDDKPLPPFLGIFILGYIEIILGVVISFLSWHFLPHVYWMQFGTQFGSIILLGYILYYVSGKRMGIIASSILTLLISIFSAKDINYIYNITHTDSSKSGQIEQVYNLNEGKIDLENIGVYSDMSYSTSRRSSKKSYTYYFVAPYLQKDFPEDKTQWLWLRNEWVEDPLRLDQFLREWEKSRLAVQIYDDSPLYAVTVVGNFRNLDLNGGVALLKPILSLEEEIVSKATPTVFVIVVLFLIWTLFGGLRMYAGRV